MNKQTMTTTRKQEQPFRCPQCRFASGRIEKICGDCGCYDESDSTCRKYGGYVAFEKWGCSSYC